MALLWLVNLGCIDLNPWQSRADAPDEPTHVLFDLDPADGLPFDAVVEAALLVRDALEAAGLRGYPRTSGASGMHILVPVVPGPTFDAVRLFARVVSRGAGARPPGPGHDARPRWPSAARGSISTTTRTGAGAASPASTRCGPARAPRWRRRCGGRRCATGLDPRDFTMGVVARAGGPPGRPGRGAPHRPPGSGRRGGPARAPAAGEGARRAPAAALAALALVAAGCSRGDPAPPREPPRRGGDRLLRGPGRRRPGRVAWTSSGRTRPRGRCARP